MDKKEPATETTKNALVRKMADKMQEKRLPSTTAVCLKVSKKAGKKWSPLKLKTDAHHVSILSHQAICLVVWLSEIKLEESDPNFHSI